MNDVSGSAKADTNTDQNTWGDTEVIGANEVFEDHTTPKPTTTVYISAKLHDRHPQPTSEVASSPRRSGQHSRPPPAFALDDAEPVVRGYAESLSRIHLTSSNTFVASETSSRRSRSPVKNVGDLMFAEKPVAIVAFDDSVALPDDIKALCDKVDDIGGGFGVIPALIFTNIVEEGKKISSGEKIRPVYRISQDQDQDLDLGSGPASKAALLRELDVLCDVVKESQRASPGGYSEAHWNTRVHSAIMVAAIEADTPRDKRSAQVFDTTAAGIASGCIPRNVNGRSLEAKMVDYCIVLSDPDIRQRCTGAVVANMQPSKVRRTKLSATSSASSVSASDNNSIASSTQTRPAADDRMHPNSINHSEYYPLRDQPIAVSIETKKPNGSDEEAKTQLSVWVSAHLLRLHQLFNKPQPIPLWLPLLYVRGSQWQLCFAVEREHCIDIIEAYKIEGTSTLLGCYKVLALLRALREWCTTVFRRRFLDLLAG